MSDKEERILITKVSPYCRARRVACDPFDNEEGMFCDRNGQYVRITDKDCAKCKNPVLTGITRAEAVHRMAVAMSNDDSLLPYYESLAEAALDALIGD